MAASNHRNTLQICGQLLTTCSGEGWRISEISRKANLSHYTAKCYITRAIKKGWMEKVHVLSSKHPRSHKGGYNIYKTTTEGRKAIVKIDDVLSFMEELY